MRLLLLLPCFLLLFILSISPSSRLVVQVQPKSERSSFAPDSNGPTSTTVQPESAERQLSSSGTRAFRTPERVPAATASRVPAARTATVVDATTVQQSYAGIGGARRTFLSERQSDVQKPRSTKRVRAVRENAESARREVSVFVMFYKCFVVF